MKKLLASFLTLAFFAAPFAANAVVIPTGRAYSGDLNISSGTVTDNSVASNIVATSTTATASTTVASVTGFSAGQYVMLYQVTGSGAGQYEFQLVRSVVGNSLFFYNNLSNQYDKDSSSTAEVIKVSEYHNVSISGGTWTAPAWNGSTGGVLVAFLTGQLLQTGGAITAPNGFGGGSGYGQGSGISPANQGNSASSTVTGGLSSSANGQAGGGGGTNGVPGNGAGGGGGYGTGGSSGGSVNSAPVGAGGNTAGTPTLSLLYFGGSGGGGDCVTAGPCSSGSGATSPGIVFISAASTTISGGSLTSNGQAGGTGTASGGGASSGGSIRLPDWLSLNVGSNLVTALSASGGGTSPGGGGSGVGRIAGVSQASLSGTTNPTIDHSSTDYVYNVDNQATNVSLGSSF